MRRGRTGSQCVTVGVVTNLTHSKYSMLEERLEQVREIDGELAYGKMRRGTGEGQPREG